MTDTETSEKKKKNITLQYYVLKCFFCDNVVQYVWMTIFFLVEGACQDTITHFKYEKRI